MSRMQLQTVSRSNPFTRLDFRPKLALVVAVTVVAFLWENTLLVGALAVGVMGTCLAAGIPRRYLRTTLGMLAPFFAILLLVHGFFNEARVTMLMGRSELTPLLTLPEGWWLVGGESFTAEGLRYGLSVIFRTVALVLVMPLAVLTTDVDRMIVALVRAGLPYKLAFIFSSALRFVPLLFEEAEAIIEAQRLRGLAVERMSPLRRLRVYARIAVPLILGALVKSQQLEVVLQARAFSGSSRRTYLHSARMGGWDYAVLLGALLACLAALILYFGWGIGRFGHPPSLSFSTNVFLT